MQLKTEQEHLRELADAISAAKSHADKIIKSLVNGKVNYKDRRGFTNEIQRATVEAESLNFYRNQAGWGKMAILLDQCNKTIIRNREWGHVSKLLETLKDKVMFLANQRRN